MISFKKLQSDTGLPTFEVRAGAAVLGIITNVGAGVGMSWRGTASDKTRVSGPSKAAITQKLQIHAAMKRGGASS